MRRRSVKELEATNKEESDETMVWQKMNRQANWDMSLVIEKEKCVVDVYILR
jgi:hypothetical protein